MKNKYLLELRIIITNKQHKRKHYPKQIHSDLVVARYYMNIEYQIVE